MIRSNSAPRSSGSIAKRPLVKRELAATPGGWEGIREPKWGRVAEEGQEGRVVWTGPGWPGLTEAGFVAFVVLPEGYQPDGEGLQEWPDGGCELWRDAAVTRHPEEGLGAETVIQQTFSGFLLCSRHCSRHIPYNVK